MAIEGDCFPKYGGPDVNVKVGDIIYYFDLDEGIREYIIESIDGNYLWHSNGAGIHAYWIGESHFKDKKECVKSAIKEIDCQLDHLNKMKISILSDKENQNGK